MGEEEYDRLESALRVLMLHLLKWDHQPDRRSRSWTASVREQRRRVLRQLRRSPGLKSQLEEALAAAYEDARHEASSETGLPTHAFPADAAVRLFRDHGAAGRLAGRRAIGARSSDCRIASRPAQGVCDSETRRPATVRGSEADADGSINPFSRKRRCACSRSPAVFARARPIRRRSRRWRGSPPTTSGCSSTRTSPSCRRSIPTTTSRTRRSRNRSRRLRDGRRQRRDRHRRAGIRPRRARRLEERARLAGRERDLRRQADRGLINASPRAFTPRRTCARSSPPWRRASCRTPLSSLPLTGKTVTADDILADADLRAPAQEMLATLLAAMEA